jgi:cytoskeleton protein RodZ
MVTEDSGSSHSQPTLGEYLKGEREKKRIALEQVAAATKVNLRILENIEEDRFSELPAKPFLKGFVGSYARFIGLDPNEVWKKFSDQIHQKYSERPSREAEFSGYAFEKRDGDSGRRNLWIVMVCFIVLGGIGFAILKPALKRRHHRTAEALAPAVIPTPSPSVSPTEERGVVASPTPVIVPPVAPVATPTVALPKPKETPVPQNSPSPRPTVLLGPINAQILAQLAVPAVKPTATPVPKGTLPTVSATPVILVISNPGAPVGAPTPVPSPTSSEKPDPLQSGVNLRPEQVRVKVLITALEDTYVRFRVDERPKNQIILRQGRILVLRATTRAVFQASVANHVAVKVNGVDYSTLEDYPGLKVNGSVKTGVAPSQLNVNIEEYLGLSQLPPPPAPSGRRISE